MKQKKHIICNSIDDIPSIITQLKNAERGIDIFITYNEKANPGTFKQFEQIFKSCLPDYFLKNVYNESNCISVEKLITNSDIIENKTFFEKCAADYNQLAHELMERFQTKFNIRPFVDVPLRTINMFNEPLYKNRGIMGNWHYCFHGFEIRFHNAISNQVVEIFLNFGGEFGVLDPQFFVEYIKSTDEYKPLPIKLLRDFHDGYRILTIMTELGIFEKIHSNFSTKHKNAIIKNRNKKVIQNVNFEAFFREVIFNKLP